MQLTTYMYNSKDMDKLAMEQYLKWKETLPDLSLGNNLTRLGQLWRKIMRAEDMPQKLLPDNIPSRSRAAEPSTSNRNEDSCQAVYSKISSSSRFHKFI